MQADVAQLCQVLYDPGDRGNSALAGVLGVGVRMLNFSDFPNLEYQPLAAPVRGNLAQSEGDYIGNDWAEHSDGAQYKELFDGQDS